MKYKFITLFFITIFLFSSISYAYCDESGEEDVQDGLPNINSILETNEDLLVSKSARYSLDGEDPFLGFNINKSVGNLIFGIHKQLIKVEITLLTWSYKLELYQILASELDVLMKPIRTVLFDTWTPVVILITLLIGLANSMNSKNTVVVNKILITTFVIFVSIIFLTNPIAILDKGKEVVNSINSDIVDTTMKDKTSSDDYLINLSNQIWIAEVEKPWELLNFRNEENALLYKDRFLALEYGSEARDKLTKELRDVVPEQDVGWITTPIFILLFSIPKIILTVILSALNITTDVIVVFLLIISGLVFLLSLLFGIWVLLKWLEKLVTAFAISIIITLVLTIMNNFSMLIYSKSNDWGIVGVLLVEFIIIICLFICREYIFGWFKLISITNYCPKAGYSTGNREIYNSKKEHYNSKINNKIEIPSDTKISIIDFEEKPHISAKSKPKDSTNTLNGLENTQDVEIKGFEVKKAEAKSIKHPVLDNKRDVSTLKDEIVEGKFEQIADPTTNTVTHSRFIPSDEVTDNSQVGEVKEGFEGTSNFIDNIIFEGADEATKLLRRQSYDEFAAATKGVYCTAEESANDYMRILTEESPWPLDFVPTKTTLGAGEEFSMAISSGYQILEDGTIKPGAFATTDYISNVDYVRNELAVKSTWKSDIDKVVTFRVKDGMSLPVNLGPVGSQIDEAAGKFLPGGGSQIEMLVPREDIMKYLEVVGEPRNIN